MRGWEIAVAIGVVLIIAYVAYVQLAPSGGTQQVVGPDGRTINVVDMGNLSRAVDVQNPSLGRAIKFAIGQRKV